MALADYSGFNTNGFHIIALLDADPDKVGRSSRADIPVLAWERRADLVRRNRIEIGIIAVPAESAQAVYEALADAGIQAVLNFAPIQIKMRDHVKVKSVDLRINLESLSFHLKNREDGVIV
jgi:redox-sensing transcriptional repressor